jgi:hypothetical protein
VLGERNPCLILLCLYEFGLFKTVNHLSSPHVTLGSHSEMVLGGKSLNYLDPGREPCEYGVGKRNPCLYMFASFKTALARIYLSSPKPCANTINLSVS